MSFPPFVASKRSGVQAQLRAWKSGQDWQSVPPLLALPVLLALTALVLASPGLGLPVLSLSPAEVVELALPHKDGKCGKPPS